MTRITNVNDDHNDDDGCGDDDDGGFNNDGEDGVDHNGDLMNRSCD